MPLIVILNESGQRAAEFTLGERPIVIGRGRGADVRLDHKSVSAQHCRVQMTPSGGIEVIDLDSTNGVRSDGKAVPRAGLRPGAPLQIGAFRIEMPGTAAGSPQAPLLKLDLEPIHEPGLSASALRAAADRQAGDIAPAGPSGPSAGGEGRERPSDPGTMPQVPALKGGATDGLVLSDASSPAEARRVGGASEASSQAANPVRPVARHRGPVLALALVAALLFIVIGRLGDLGAAYDRVVERLRGVAPVAHEPSVDPADIPPPGEAPVEVGRTTGDNSADGAAPSTRAIDPLAGLGPVDMPPAIEPPVPSGTGPEPTRHEEAEDAGVTLAPPEIAPPPKPVEPPVAVGAGAAPPIPEPVPTVADPEFDTAAIRQSHLALSRRAVGKTQPVTLRGGEVMEGIILDITDSRVLCRITRGSGSAEIPFPIETVEKIGESPVLTDLALLRDQRRAALRPNDAAGLYALAGWCGTNGLPKSRGDLLEAVLAIDPNHAFARADLGYVAYGGGWRRAEKLRAEGLGCWNDQWLSAEDLRKRGLVEYAGEWMTADEANARKGLVKVAGQWVTKDEAGKLRQGLVNYCGLWIPARVAFAIMKDSYYEQLLRRARPMPAADFEKNEERIFALHLQKAEEDEVSPLTSGQRREELQRLAAIVRRSRELPDADFALNVRLLAQEMVYRTQADRLGYDRYQDPLATARRVELESEIAAANLINAVKVNDHQAGHAYLIALEADRLRQDIESRAGKLNDRAAKALAVLREALVGGVNVGFEVPPKIEGPAAGSDHEITLLREEYLKGLARLEMKLRKVLTPEQVAMAVQYQPTVDAVSTKDLDRKADKAKKGAPGGT